MFALTILTVLASLNRETSLLIPACYAAYCVGQWHTRGYWLRVGFLVAVWALITTLLHIWLGSAPHVLGLSGTLQHNLDSLGSAIINNAPLIPVWIAAVIGFRRKPRALQALAVVGLLYTGTVIVGATWAEVRLILPVLILALPLMLYK